MLTEVHNLKLCGLLFFLGLLSKPGSERMKVDDFRQKEIKQQTDSKYTEALRISSRSILGLMWFRMLAFKDLTANHLAIC